MSEFDNSFTNVTPFVARQKVNVLLLVGTGLLSETPALVAAEGRLRWRVPVALSLPWRGRLGEIGAIDVDVHTGEVLADDILIRDLTHRANQLAASPAS